MEHTAKPEAATHKTAHEKSAAPPESAPRKSAGTSSRGTKRLEEIDRRVSKAVRRVTKALDHGVTEYSERRDKSRAARKDGVVTDFVENMAYGLSKAVSTASPLIHDAAELVNSAPVRKQVRKVARSFGKLPFIN
jgi:DNA topoisomerase VI subunit B